MKTLVAAALALFTASAFAEIDWPSLKFTKVATGADHPVYITGAGDGSGRLFVVEQPGRIQIASGTGGYLAAPFLDITDRVQYSGEQGLLSVAFPPGFAAKKHFYVNYTGTNGDTFVSRFNVSAGDGNVADPASETLILTVPQPYSNHNGGQLQFGPDGFLYIGMGDGGSGGDPENRAQNPQQLLGKMLRIDVEGNTNPYGIPASNPFVGNAAYKPEIWALGLRNPWRFSFDKTTGDLYIGDVGQDAFEEIDFQPAASAGGQNYGWRLAEAGHKYNTAQRTGKPVLTFPIFEYNHSEGESVIGGFVARAANALRMAGMYFYGDYESGKIWGLKNDAGHWRRGLPVSVDAVDPQEVDGTISTLGQGDDGAIYFAHYEQGGVYHIEDDGRAIEPTINLKGRKAVLTTASPRAVIHYTVNGIDPVETDPIAPLHGSLKLTSGMTLKARAFRADLQPSDVAQASVP